MIINKKFEKFELELLRREKPDIESNYKILESLYQEAKSLGIIPLKNPLDGLEIDIKIARVLNNVH
jgi:hypothetical protein